MLSNHSAQADAGALMGVGQYRLDGLQLLNWGGYNGYHYIPVGGGGLAIVGPTGKGKSTLLDAIAAVIMPNPQQFNQAARDDRTGTRGERTVYTYARGKLDEQRDSSGTITTQFLRPPGNAFISGVALVFVNDLGTQITASRVMYLAADAAADDLDRNTFYTLVPRDFRLNELGDLKPTGRSRKPLTLGTLAELIGDVDAIVTSSQPTMRTAFCDSVGIYGDTSEQDNALKLLRNAQASKGIYSINKLFKEFVLSEPLAISRWDEALSNYQHTVALYDEFERARTKLAVLEPLSDAVERYRAAMADHRVKVALRRPAGEDQCSRVDVFVEQQLHDWADRGEQQQRQIRKALSQKADEARAEVAKHRAAASRAQESLMAAGGDQSLLIQAELRAAQDRQRQVQERFDTFADLVTGVGMTTPATTEEYGQLLDALVEAADDAKRAIRSAQSETDSAAAEVTRSGDARRALASELATFERRRSNIPTDADERRKRIADAIDLPPSDLPYAGELFEVHADHQHWRIACHRVLGELATHLLIPRSHYAAARHFVNNNNMFGKIIVVQADPHHRSGERLIAGTVPAMLQLAEDSPFHDWLHDHLVQHYSVLCVQRPEEFDQPFPDGVKHAVTAQGLRTMGSNRVLKDDRSANRTWIGLDNSSLVHDIREQLEAAELRFTSAHQNHAEHAANLQRQQQRLATISQVQAVNWSDIDLAPGQATIDGLRQQLTDYDQASPHVAELKETIAQHHKAGDAALTEQTKLDAERERVDKMWEEFATIKDECAELIETATPLTDVERISLEQIGFRAPQGLHDVAARRGETQRLLQEHIDRHAHDVERYSDRVLKIMAEFKAIDPRAQFDTHIDSLPTLVAIHQQLRDDDLPRAQAAWLERASGNMLEGLRSVLLQITSDVRAIAQGIEPINQVLAAVDFREGSRLRIETRAVTSVERKKFHETLLAHTNIDPNVGLGKDPETLERNFLALRRDVDTLQNQAQDGKNQWRAHVLDAREHVQFSAIETLPNGTELVHEGVAGKSGGEGQELIAFVLGAALRYRLGDGNEEPPVYAPIVLDEGFVKADSEYTGRALAALKSLGFQLIIGAPRDKIGAFEDHIEHVAYIDDDPTCKNAVRVYPMRMAQALEL